MQPKSTDFDLADKSKFNIEPIKEEKKTLWKVLKEKPLISILLLAIIMGGCLFAQVIMTKDPKYMDLSNVNIAPSKEFIFGTDSMGRDIFSMIWYGGRISLFIGFLATIISTTIAIVYGAVSGNSSEVVDDIMMRITEILLSMPSILIIIFIQAILGSTTPISIAIVIGITSWMNIAKIIRSEVRQIRNSEFIIAAKTMGGSFIYLLRRHLLPNFVAAIMFMVVTNIGAAIGTEATLSFLGIGLPVEIISWGSMLSLAEQALLSNCWWVILIPGVFLVITLVSIANIGNYLRKSSNKKSNNL